MSTRGVVESLARPFFPFLPKLRPKSSMERLTFPFLRQLLVRVHVHTYVTLSDFPLLSLSFAVRDECTRGELCTLERLRVHKARRIAVALSRGRPCAPSAGGGCRGIAAENEDGKKRERWKRARWRRARRRRRRRRRVLRGW